jgi:hypothetical protein
MPPRKRVEEPLPRKQTILPELFPEQAKITAHSARFKVVSVGRGGGKSSMAMAECIYEAIVLGHTCIWAVPKSKNADQAWDDLTHWVYNNTTLKPGKGVFKDEQRVNFLAPSGNPYERWGSIRVASMHDPDNHRGGQADLVVFDECAYQPDEYAWHFILEPKLTVRRGRAYFISTPKGRNWFYKLAMDAKEHMENGGKEWVFFSRASFELNPLIQMDVMERLKEKLPPLVYQQEYLAQFVDGGSSVFYGIDDVLLRPDEAPTEPVSGHTYVAGVDWGHGEDSTYISVWDATTQQEAYLQKINVPDFNGIYSRLESVLTRWQVTKACVEYNSIGVKPAEDLIERMRGRTYIEPVNMNASTKPVIVDSLRLAIGNKEVRLLPDHEALEEMLAYEAVVTSTGYVTYNAAAGAHDDAVIARCMAYRAVTGERVAEARSTLLTLPVEGLFGMQRTRRNERKYGSTLWRRK